MLATPNTFSRRALTYRQLGTLIEAGIPLAQAIRSAQKIGPGKFSRSLAFVGDQLEAGSDFASAVSSVDIFPIIDQALLSAGETAGTLDESFKLLAEYYETEASLLRRFIADMGYPIFMVHFAALILPFPALFASGNWTAFLWEVGKVLIPCYAVTFAIFWLLHEKRSVRLRATLEKVLHVVPFLGKTRREFALARLTMALRSLISAGVPILRAWKMAAVASGSGVLEKEVFSWGPQFDNGLTPAHLVRASGKFPESFESMYETAELSGQMEDILQKLHVMYIEDAGLRMRTLMAWLPKIIYFGIAITIAWRIVSFYVGFYGGMTSEIDSVLK